jgi:hypothetical protein
MRSLRSLTTIVTFALITACGEQPSDVQLHDSDAPSLSRAKRLAPRAAELRAHTPRRPASAALLVSAPSYTQLDDAAARGSGGSIHLTLNAGSGIPRHPDAFIRSVAVFGYAWADLGSGKAIVTVIHPTIGRDSRQNPDGWHTHPVQLAAGTISTGGTSDFCIVSIGRSQAGIAIQSDRMRTNMALHWAGLGVAALDVAASFVVQADAGCSGSGLGVDVLDTESL